MTPNADTSCAIMMLHLLQQDPFFFVRIGDGAVECVRGMPGHTADHEQYHPVLASAMRETIRHLKAEGDRVLWGDWRTAVAGSAPNHVPEWEELVDAQRRLTLNYEALLLMRRSEQLLNFYHCVRNDPRRKLYVGAHYQTGAPTLLDSLFLPLPTGGVFQHRDVITHYLNHARPEIILFGAGMGGLVPIVEYWEKHPATTCIHLGSALDPLFVKPTRSRQLSMADARDFLKELL